MTTDKKSSTRHFNVAQLRIDLWNQLRSQLHEHQKEEKGSVEAKSTSELLNDLAII